MRLTIFLLLSFCLSACLGVTTFDTRLQAIRAKDEYIKKGNYKKEYLKDVADGSKRVDSYEYQKWLKRVEENNLEYLEWCKEDVLSFFEERGLQARIKQSEQNRDYAIRRSMKSVDYAKRMHSEYVAELTERAQGGEKRKSADLKECDGVYNERTKNASVHFPFKGTRYEYLPKYKKVTAFKEANCRSCTFERRGDSTAQFVCMDERRPNSVKIFRY